MKLILIFSSFILSMVIGANGQPWLNGPTTGDIYYNSGNVGVGTSIPSNTQGWNKVLDVSAPIASKILSTASDQTYRVGIYSHSQWNGGGGFVGTETNHNLFFITNYDPKMVINTAGNVGIGTSSPNTRLEIAGPTRIAGANGLSIGPDGNRLRIQSNSDIADQAFCFINAQNSFEGIRVRQISVGANYADLRMAPTSGVVIEGNVGIGTYTPQVKLDVAGWGHFTGRISTSGAIANDNNAAFNNTDPTGYGLFSQGGGGTRYAFHFLNQPGETIMLGKSNGNVGIGTANPDQKLTVKGIIHTEEVRVDMTVPGPDYVFESTYNLLPLSEVEAYIKANKHLPEVPSAKQMEEEGLNLKEMNLLLLKKVEELTLHLIEQSKINDEQANILQAQKKEIAELKTKMK